MGKISKSVRRTVISVLYIIWGFAAPMTAFNAILDFNIPAVIGAAGGIAMLVAGILGLLRVKKSMCRLLGIIILAVNAASFCMSLAAGAFMWQPLVSAILAFLFMTGI